MTFQTALLALRCNFRGIAPDSRGDSSIIFASFYFGFSLIFKGVQYRTGKAHLWKVALAEAAIDLKDLTSRVQLWQGVNLQRQVHHPTNVNIVQDLEP